MDSPASGSGGRRKLLVVQGLGLDIRGTTEETRIRYKSIATIKDYDARIRSAAEELGIEVEHLQFNDLEECKTRLQHANEDAIVINPAGWTTSDELAACIASLHMPVIEAHYGNFSKNGTVSKVTPACRGLICGCKLESYVLAMRAALEALEPSDKVYDYTPPGCA
mmetsp:Transcript_17077/g.25794  ORF Transcript_17077/g.25794 Transcript_17077/m.25794 type:complete len:166 (+) Transcript_17077:79-576(+)